MEIKRTQAINCVLVALINGEIRIYNDKYLIYSLKSDVRFLSNNEYYRNKLLE